MATVSSIEWTDFTWNPVTGCTKVSQGCKHCYAERIAGRFWNNRVFTDVLCHLDRLNDPIKWKKPRTVFVNSMSDLFHEDVPFEFINRVFEVMASAQQHTFQILTKRPERMLEWHKFHGQSFATLPNIWLGVSVEDQLTTDERLPLLLKVNVAVRWASVEPLLQPVNLKAYISGLHWVVVGGESGPGARPMEQEWVHSLHSQCELADVPFFFKQWGGIRKKKTGRSLNNRTYDEMPRTNLPVGYAL